MNQLLKTIIIVALSTVILAAISVFFMYQRISDPPITGAYISSLQGPVEILREGKIIPAVNEMELQESDTIRTQGGETEMVLRESVFIHLKPNTEVLIKELSPGPNTIRVKQTQGSMWSKFTSLLGVQTYEASLPYTTATVRGTAFLSKVEDHDIFIGAEGVTRLSNINNAQTIDLTVNQKAISKGDISTEKITSEERGQVQAELAEDLKRLKQLRLKIIHNYQWLVDQYKKQYGATDQDLSRYLDMIDRGELDDAKLIEQAPVKLPVLYRLKKINDLIKEQTALINAS